MLSKLADFPHQCCAIATSASPFLKPFCVCYRRTEFYAEDVVSLAVLKVFNFITWLLRACFCLRLSPKDAMRERHAGNQYTKCSVLIYVQCLGQRLRLRYCIEESQCMHADDFSNDSLCTYCLHMNFALLYISCRDEFCMRQQRLKDIPPWWAYNMSTQRMRLWHCNAVYQVDWDGLHVYIEGTRLYVCLNLLTVSEQEYIGWKCQLITI